jgi:hypothetical protein
MCYTQKQREFFAFLYRFIFLFDKTIIEWG